jgi:hypothetical protein
VETTKASGRGRRHEKGSKDTLYMLFFGEAELELDCGAIDGLHIV